MNNPAIAYNVSDRVGTIVIDRPQVKNALQPEDWQALGRAFALADADSNVRVILLRGANRTFSAGGDLKTMPDRLSLALGERSRQLASDAQLIEQMHHIDKPIVALIEGVCIGAGLSLALACDLRFATHTTKLGATFHRIGLTGDFGMLWHLPRIVGPTHAARLLYLSEIITGDEAERIGLVHRAFADNALETEVNNIVRTIADGPPVAIAMTKQGLLLSAEHDLKHHLSWEAEAQAICSKTADAAEGVAAFQQKRPARFTGK